jgi:ATP-dependent Zn protease
MIMMGAACVLQVGREDEFSINRQQMVARILVSMGGTVAEELVFGRDQVGNAYLCTLVQSLATSGQQRCYC